MWRNLSEADLDVMMARADRQRYEKRDDNICAFYGHSMPAKIQKSEAVPPPVLYHGTAPDKPRSFCAKG
jgi:putative RNA 2'-phosphotransferase